MPSFSAIFCKRNATFTFSCALGGGGINFVLLLLDQFAGDAAFLVFADKVINDVAGFLGDGAFRRSKLTRLINAPMSWLRTLRFWGIVQLVLQIAADAFAQLFRILAPKDFANASSMAGRTFSFTSTTSTS